MEGFLSFHIPGINLVAHFPQVRAPSEFAIWTWIEVMRFLWLYLGWSVDWVQETYQVPGLFRLPLFGHPTAPIKSAFFSSLDDSWGDVAHCTLDFHGH